MSQVASLRVSRYSAAGVTFAGGVAFASIAGIVLGTSFGFANLDLLSLLPAFLLGSGIAFFGFRYLRRRLDSLSKNFEDELERRTR